MWMSNLNLLKFSSLKNGCFQKYGYPQIIHFNRGFHYKPSILGYPYFWKHQISLLYVLLCSHKWQVLILKIKSSINLTFRSIEFRKFHTLIVGIISQVNKKNNGYFSQLQKKPLDHPENPELKGGKKWEFRRMVRCQKNPSTSHDAGGHCYSRHVPEPRKTLLLSIKLVV